MPPVVVERQPHTPRRRDADQERKLLGDVGQQQRAEVDVEPIVLPSRTGQVPGVHEDIGRVELVDRLVEWHLADLATMCNGGVTVGTSR